MNSPAAGHLEVRVLGAFEVFQHTAPAQKVRIGGFISVKAQALLAFLIVTRQRHTRDALATLFWGDMPAADARANLRKALSNLNHLLAPYLDIDRDGVSLRGSAPLVLDLSAFETQAAGPGLHELISAAELYRGELLHGLDVRDAPGFEEWLLIERERMRNQACQMLRMRAQMHVRAGDGDDALATLRRLVSIDPLDESAHRQLMLLLARCGQRPAALAHFALCKRILRAELGIEPDMATQQLAATIGSAARVLQLLPVPTPLVGRHAELKLLRQWLCDPDCQLISIVGLGGVGKSHLAHAAASASSNLFMHGVCMLALNEVHEVDELALALLAALGVQRNPSLAPTRQVQNVLRPQELLLVLDNFEQLVTGAAIWLSQLVHAAPSLRLLITTRLRLNLHAERVVQLDGLAATDAQSDAVQLFCQIMSFKHGQMPMVDASILEICRLLGGLPLGIELAATAARTLPTAEIARMLAQRVDVLVQDSLDADPRHRALRDVFDQSWRMLGSAEQTVFAMSSVFYGGFTHQACAAVAGCEMPLIRRLVEASLLRMDAQQRCQLHPLLAGYARERLALRGADHIQAQRQHARFFLAQLGAAEHALKYGHDQDMRSQLDSELANISAGWEHACAIDDDEARGWLMAAAEAALVLFEMNGNFARGHRLFALAATAFARSSSRPHVLARANALAGIGWFCFRLGQLDEALQHVQLSLSVCASVDATTEMAYPTLFLGASLYGQGKPAAALVCFRQACDMYRRAADAWGLSGALNNLGQALTAIGEYTGAHAALAESLALYQTHHIVGQIGHGYNSLAELQLAMGDVQAAKASLELGLAAAEQTGQAFLAMMIHTQLLNIHASLGDMALVADSQRTLQKLALRLGENSL